MARDITAHDATTNISEGFHAARSSRIVITIKWAGIVGSAGELYRIKQSNFDDAINGDNVPAIPGGVIITDGADSATIEVNSPADYVAHVYNAGGISAGTIDIKTKLLHTND